MQKVTGVKIYKIKLVRNTIRLLGLSYACSCWCNYFVYAFMCKRDNCDYNPNYLHRVK